MADGKAELSITSPDELQEWLKDKPVEWAQVIALRSALRVLPLAIDPENWQDNLPDPRFILKLLRTAAILQSIVGYKFPNKARFFSVIREAVDAMELGDLASFAEPVEQVIVSLGKVGRLVASSQANEFAATNLCLDSVEAASNSLRARAYAKSATHSGARSAGLKMFDAVSIDCKNLQVEIDVSINNLWPIGLSPIAEDSGRAIKWLQTTGMDFEIWMEWFESRLSGEPLSFVSLSIQQDVDFEDWLITQDDFWWMRDPAQVNQEISEKINELSNRESQVKPDGEEVETDPQSSTAPIFNVGSNGKLAVEVAAGREELSRHSSLEPLRQSALDRVGRLGKHLGGDNNAPNFTPICERLSEALGNAWEEISPHALVLESQSLRKALEIQQSFGPKDEWCALEGSDLQAADDAISALNMLIGSVDYLEEIETKRLGPDHHSPIPTPEQLVEVADTLKTDEATEEKTDHLIRVAADNAPEIPDREDRKTGLAVRVGLNLVRVSINLIVDHEKEFSASVMGGAGVGALTAGLIPTAAVLGPSAGLAWLLAKNIHNNREKWREIAKSADVTAENFEKLLAKLDKLPLDG